MPDTNPAMIAQQEIEFVSSTSIPTGTGVNLQSGALQRALTKKVGEIKDDYQAIINQVNFIIEGTDSKVENSGFKLSEITVGLAFSATGKLAFIAEAGVEASVEITFTRK